MDRRIPFGYDIIDGKAVINERKMQQLKLYFKNYLDGQSMADAARVAHLPVSSSTYPNLFKRKEYCGTDYYPAVITKEYQKQLVTEWQRRKDEHPRRRRKQADKGVRVYTHFRMASTTTNPSNNLPEQDLTEQNPTERMAVFYQRIRPDYTHHNHTQNRNTNRNQNNTKTPSSR